MMASKSKVISNSEHRRVYMQALVRETTAITGCTQAEAKVAATLFLTMLQHRVKHGKPVDLGFMKMTPRRVKPTTVRCNVGLKVGQVPREIHIGETFRWQVRVRKSWQRRTRPAWSRYS